MGADHHGRDLEAIVRDKQQLYITSTVPRARPWYLRWLGWSSYWLIVVALFAIVFVFLFNW